MAPYWVILSSGLSRWLWPKITLLIPPPDLLLCFVSSSQFCTFSRSDFLTLLPCPFSTTGSTGLHEGSMLSRSICLISWTLWVCVCPACVWLSTKLKLWAKPQTPLFELLTPLGQQSVSPVRPAPVSSLLLTPLGQHPVLCSLGRVRKLTHWAEGHLFAGGGPPPQTTEIGLPKAILSFCYDFCEYIF